MADANEALEYIIFLSRHLDDSDALSLVTLILIDLNFSETHDGFDYLRRAIILYLQYQDRIQMKVLYSDVGRSYPQKVRWKQVERCMRYAMDEAWASVDRKRWDMLFSVDQNGEPAKPTNSEFIARIASLIQVWQACRKEDLYEEVETGKYAIL